MSKKSSFKEALERPGATKARSPKRSGSLVSFLLRKNGEISRPVDVVRTLMARGLSLRKAHAMLQRIAAEDRVAIQVRTDDPTGFIARLAELGIMARSLERPEVSLQKVRGCFGLTQAEFAIRFGFELDTIQNWEQGRFGMDSNTQLLLAIIQRNPEVVEAALTNETYPASASYGAELTGRAA